MANYLADAAAQLAPQRRRSDAGMSLVDYALRQMMPQRGQVSRSP